MSPPISDQAEQAREAHRLASGRFGAQVRAEADIDLPAAAEVDLVDAAEDLYSTDPESFDVEAAHAIAASWTPDPEGYRIIGAQEPEEIAPGVFLNQPSREQEWASSDPAALAPGADVQAGAAVPVMDLRVQMETEVDADPRCAPYVPLAEPVEWKVDESTPERVRRWLEEPHPWSSEGLSRADFYTERGVYGFHQVPGEDGLSQDMLIHGAGQDEVAPGVAESLGVPAVDTELGKAEMQLRTAGYFFDRSPHPFDAQQREQAEQRYVQARAQAGAARAEHTARFAARVRDRLERAGL